MTSFTLQQMKEILWKYQVLMLSKLKDEIFFNYMNKKWWNYWLINYCLIILKNSRTGK